MFFLKDPVVVRLADGRYRMYATAYMRESPEDAYCASEVCPALVSATAG